MESFNIDPSSRAKDSHPSRSRSGSHLSATASRFQDLNLDSNVRSLESQEGSVSETATTTSTPSFLDPNSNQPQQTSSNYISAPVPQQYAQFPLLSDSRFDTNWSYDTSSEEHLRSPPVVRLDSACVSPHNLGEQGIGNSDSFSRSSSFSPANMSTIGVQQYDHRFEPAGIRPSFTWPHFDMDPVGDQYLPQLSHGMTSGQLTPFNDPKLMPMYARSVSNSPPRAGFTPEQRELKRQRDQARRGSKEKSRRDRSLSNPYSTSQRTSPNLLARSVTEFPSTLVPSPLLPQGSPNMSTSNYLTTPYSSQILSDQGSSDMYGTMFPMGGNDYNNTLPSYASLPPFSGGSAESTLRSFAPRAQSHSVSSSDQNSLYQAQPSVKPESSNESGDQVRVVHSRPKPQCWEHGCNGRQFSTFSNLLRHQREKSGQASKSTCPNCGAEFTRTTARNGHMAHEKCKQRKNS